LLFFTFRFLSIFRKAAIAMGLEHISIKKEKMIVSPAGATPKACKH
jgi:hypothetical protein